MNFATAPGTRATHRFQRAVSAGALVFALALGVGAAAGTPRALEPTAPAAGPAVPAAVTPGCVIDTRGILGWWRGEDDLAAQIGPALTGTSNFAKAYVRRGMVLDGSQTLEASTFPTVTTGLSVEMWIKPAANGLVQALASRWDFPGTDDSARTFALLLGPGGQLIFDSDETSTRRPEELQAIAPVLFDGNFHHVAATWDQADIKLYVDGIQVAAKASQGGVLNPAATTPFRLGSELGLGDQFHYSGIIDEPAVWGRALAADEIGAIVAADGGGKCTFVPVQKAKLTASNGKANDWFGFAADIDGPTAVVGAPYASVATQFSGATYVYQRSGTSWTQEAMLIPTDAGLVDLDGYSVAVEGNTIVIGSYGNNGGGRDSGAAYVFTRTGTVWTQQAKLLAGDAAPGDGFGYSVDISGDTIVVGTPLHDGSATDTGSVYVFVRSGTSWTQQARLEPGDVATNDNFGGDVGIDGNTIVAGSSGDDNVGTNSGSAYVFTRTGTSWTQQAKLMATDAADGDQFGFGVGIDTDTVTVGAPYDDDGGSNSGSAYVFSRTGTSWAQSTKIVASDPAAGDQFGGAVGLDGSEIVVGAYGNGSQGTQSGSAYVFIRSGPSWTELTKLLPDDGAIADEFGFSVAVSGSVLVGAFTDDAPQYNSGSAYVFTP
jgi:hypothetical protein